MRKFPRLVTHDEGICIPVDIADLYRLSLDDPDEIALDGLCFQYTNADQCYVITPEVSLLPREKVWLRFKMLHYTRRQNRWQLDAMNIEYRVLGLEELLELMLSVGRIDGWYQCPEYVWLPY